MHMGLAMTATPSSPAAGRIELDDLSRQEVQDLLREHLANMHELSPPESVHALDLAELRSPDITFWTICRPFADYKKDSNTVFMSLEL